MAKMGDKLANLDPTEFSLLYCSNKVLTYFGVRWIYQKFYLGADFSGAVFGLLAASSTAPLKPHQKAVFSKIDPKNAP